MLNNQGQAASIVQMIIAASCANTAAATSAWIDVRAYEGDLVIVINPGAITGSLTPSIEDATDGSGTGAAAIAANEGAYTAHVANTARKYTIPASFARGWIRYVGTIVTGPSLLGVQLLSHPKYTI
jgi:hypothetical protein